jgi:hypothetical protein
MTSDFQDHFSGFSGDYRSYRPSYPADLFSWLASISSGHERAWDCATGTGQAATRLAEHFFEVIATDASETQIASAEKRDNVQYYPARAEDSGIETESVDLVTVAQAIHWFDQKAFRAEADRVLKKEGIVAVWAYDLLHISPAIDDVVNHLYGPILEKHWPPERRIIEQGYRDIDFPYQKIVAPEFSMNSTWNLAGLAGYLNTWSAVKRYIQERKTNPVEIVFDDLSAAWGKAENEYQVVWPMTILAWRK